jgi:hypothetical protein
MGKEFKGGEKRGKEKKREAKSDGLPHGVGKSARSAHPPTV